MRSDGENAQIQNFLEVATHIFAARYVRQITRHYESLSVHNIVHIGSYRFPPQG